MKTRDLPRHVYLTLTGESSQTTFQVTHFAMLEPSTMHCRFTCADGRTLESHGQLITYIGDIDSLPTPHPPVDRIAEKFGVTVEQVKAQFAKNAVTCRDCAKRAGSGEYRGYSRAEWSAFATAAEQRSV